MSHPYMPLYVADYLSATEHLGAAESGAYLHLIMHYWQKGGLPSNDVFLARIARMTGREWARHKPVIKAFFNDDWTHERIDQLLLVASEKSMLRSAAGQRGGIAKSLKQKDAAVANATILPQQNPSKPPSKSLPSSSGLDSERKKEELEATPLVNGALNGHAVDAPLAKKKRLPTESDERLLDEVTDLWNPWARAHGSPQVEELTKTRATHCRHRIADLMQRGYSTPTEAFRFLLGKCDESFFAHGAARTPLKFDQLMRESFMVQMIEGSFAYNKPTGARQWAR